MKRATSLSIRRIPRALKIISACVIAVAALAVIIVAPSSGEATAWKPRTASALTNLPAAASVPARVETWARAVSRRAGPANALARVRLLRSGLGSRHADVYGFANGVGGYCVLLVGDSGTCSDGQHLAKVGVQWTIGGGLPGAPGTMFALVTDDVVSVELFVDGAPQDVSLENNVAFAEYPTDGNEALIRVTYEAGSTHESRIQLGGNAPALNDIQAP